MVSTLGLVKVQFHLLQLSLINLQLLKYFLFFSASEDEVSERASLWDQPVADYIELAEKYLGFQQPGSVYGFADARDGHKRVSTSNSASMLMNFVFCVENFSLQSRNLL